MKALELKLIQQVNTGTHLPTVKASLFFLKVMFDNYMEAKRVVIKPYLSDKQISAMIKFKHTPFEFKIEFKLLKFLRWIKKVM